MRRKQTLSSTSLVLQLPCILSVSHFNVVLRTISTNPFHLWWCVLGGIVWIWMEGATIASLGMRQWVWSSIILCHLECFSFTPPHYLEHPQHACYCMQNYILAIESDANLRLTLITLPYLHLWSVDLWHEHFIPCRLMCRRLVVVLQ